MKISIGLASVLCLVMAKVICSTPHSAIAGNFELDNELPVTVNFHGGGCGAFDQRVGPNTSVTGALPVCGPWTSMQVTIVEGPETGIGCTVSVTGNWELTQRIKVYAGLVGEKYKLQMFQWGRSPLCIPWKDTSCPDTWQRLEMCKIIK